MRKSKYKLRSANNKMLEVLEGRLLMAMIGVTNSDDAAERDAILDTASDVLASI